MGKVLGASVRTGVRVPRTHAKAKWIMAAAGNPSSWEVETEAFGLDGQPD